jgi:hypothetical protein
MMQASSIDEQRKRLILVVVGLTFCLVFALVINRIPSAVYRSDIYLRWYAVNKLFTEGRNLYDDRNGEEVTSHAWGAEGYPREVNFFYPAHVVVLIGPLALLPYPVAHLVWTTAIQWLFLGGVWLSMKATGWPESVNGKTLVMAMAVLSVPHLQHTIWGQFNTIGVLSLVLCYQALRRGRYGWAGIWAVGLTFKPHVTALVLIYLLGWAAFKRERWRFYLGFALTGGVMWLFTELLQPGWIPDFLATLGGYGTAWSVLDRIWNPGQAVAIALCTAVLIVSGLNGRASAASPTFTACLALVVAAWFLAVPVVGMLHVVLLAVVAVLLLSSIRATWPMLYRYALWAMILLYVLGFVGFLWGLSSPELYGRHIAWAELAYRTAAPILVGLLAIMLCLRVRRDGIKSA